MAWASGNSLTPSTLNRILPSWMSSLVSGTGLGVVNIKDHGAVGDGTTDDTSAVQAALTAGANKIVYAPPGTYLITGAEVPSGTILRGAGPATVFKRPVMDGSVDMNLIRTVASARSVLFEDFCVDGNGSNQSLTQGSNENQVGVRFATGTQYSLMRRLQVKNSLNANIYLDTCTGCIVTECVANDAVGDPAYPGGSTGVPGDGIAMREGSDNIIANNVATGNHNDGIVVSSVVRTKVIGNSCHSNVAGYGVESYTGISGTSSIGNVIVGNSIGGNGLGGILVAIAAPSNVGDQYDGVIGSNAISSNSGTGIALTGTRRISVVGNVISNCSGNGLEMNQASFGVISGNVFSGNNKSNISLFGHIYVYGTSQFNHFGGNVFQISTGKPYYNFHFAAATVTDTVIGVNSGASGFLTSNLSDGGARTTLAIVSDNNSNDITVNNIVAGIVATSGEVRANNVGGNIRFRGSGAGGGDGAAFADSTGTIYYSDYSVTRGWKMRDSEVAFIGSGLTFDLTGARVSVRTTGTSATSLTVRPNELQVFVGGTSGATLCLRSGGTLYYFASSASTVG